jgi:hypothetical protein
LEFEAAFDRKLESVQAGDIQAVLKKWLKPDQLIIIQALDPSAAGPSS